MSERNAETIEAITLGDKHQAAAQFIVLPEEPNSLQAVTFDGGASSCGDDDEVVDYVWEFGDGSSAQSAKPIVQHNFPIAGHYVVRLVVETRSGLRAEITKKVRVGFRLKLNFEPRCPLAGNPARFVAQAFVNLHAEDAICEYTWDLNGDGNFEVGRGDGEATICYAAPGTYTARVRATNVRGVSEEAERSVTVFEPFAS